MKKEMVVAHFRYYYGICVGEGREKPAEAAVNMVAAVEI
jgi:hypothetical protein